MKSEQNSEQAGAIEQITPENTGGVRVSDEERQKLIEAAITKATGAHRVLNAYDYEDVFACCEAVLAACGVKTVDGGQHE